MRILPFFDEIDSPNPWPVCGQFATLEGIDERDDPECKLCDHLEMEHAGTGRRAISTEEIVAAREFMLDQAFAVEIAQSIALQG
jgi:hypothetical protein